MNKTIIASLITATAITCAHATTTLSNDSSKKCLEISHSLNQITEGRYDDKCSGDVDIAAAYIESAGHDLSHDQQTKALTSLTYGQNELKEIIKWRSYCTNLSPLVKPYLAKVILLKTELENESLPPVDDTED